MEDLHKDADLLDIENDIGLAVECFADGEDRKAAVLLERCNQRLRIQATGPHRKEAFRLWAMSHACKEDWDQALLKYEQVLAIDPADEDALWQTVLIFLRPLEKPETARTMLLQKLLPLYPNDEYQDALREAEAALGIERPTTK